MSRRDYVDWPEVDAELELRAIEREIECLIGRAITRLDRRLARRRRQRVEPAELPLANAGLFRRDH